MRKVASNSVDYLSLLRLDGRGCVVLGSGPGMGRATANALSQAGAAVLCVDIDQEMADIAAREANGYACKADITKREEMERVFEEAGAKLGRVDGVVDIVGYNRIVPFLDFDDESFDYIQRMVLYHAYLAMQIGSRSMVERGGAMVFIGSSSGLVSFEKQAVYGAFKAGLHHLVRCAAYELAPQRVRVNVVAPGSTKVPRLVDNLPDEIWAEADKVIPLGGSNEASDIAGSVLFLLSDLARKITGHILVIDGGQLLTAPHPPLVWGRPKKTP